MKATHPIMTDDTDAPDGPVAAHQRRAKTTALVGVAALALVLAALAFTLSFDALRQLTVEIGVRPHLAWMAPVALDIAQAAAMLALVAFGAGPEYRTARWYCMALATATVVLSVAGNGYHAFRVAVENATLVAAGVDLGYSPQPAAIAAGIAVVPPLLWLALLHLFTLVLRALTLERNRSATVQTVDTNGNEPVQPEARNDTSVDVAVAHNEPDGASTVRNEPAAVAALAPTVRNEPSVDSSVAQEAATGSGDVATQREPVARTRRNAFPQTRNGLLSFVGECTLRDDVKRVAVALITEPHTTYADVADHEGVDKSTVCRRWQRFKSAAQDEGFTYPPLLDRPLEEPAANRVLQSVGV